MPDPGPLVFFSSAPRGSGKSTWIRTAVEAAVSYDLLDAAESIRLAADPGLLARGVSEELRQSVQNWFEMLVDTLLGSWLPAWKLKRATKQVGHPKFYLFDSGAARALSGRLPYSASPEERGPLFETLIHNELCAYLEYSGLGYPLFFWRTPDGVEVDFLCETASGYTAIEVKAATGWRPAASRGTALL